MIKEEESRLLIERMSELTEVMKENNLINISKTLMTFLNKFFTQLEVKTEDNQSQFFEGKILLFSLEEKHRTKDEVVFVFKTPKNKEIRTFRKTYYWH